MQVTELKNEGLEFQIKVILPSAKIANEVQKELASLSKKVKLDGFRAGKVPSSLIDKKYRPSVLLDVVQHEINHAIQHIVKDYKLKTIGDPKLEDLVNEENKDLEFTLKFELLPNIELPNFKEIVIDLPKLVIKEEEVDQQIEKLAGLSKDYSKESTEKLEKDQQATIDAVGYINDEAFEGGKVTDHKLVIGSGAFIAGFEDQLIGSKAGEEVEVNVTFPTDYHMQQLAGQPAKFIVQVKNIHVAQDIVIDDEFAKKFKCKDLEELRANISKRMEAELAASIRSIMKIKLFDQLEKLLTFDVPQSLMTQELNVLKSQTEKDHDADELFKNKSEEEISEYYNKLALRRVRVGLMLTEYMKIKDLRIEQSDIQNAIIAQTRNFPGQEKAFWDFYQKNPKAIERLRGPILEEKAVQHLLDNELTLNEKLCTREELGKFLAQEEERFI
jgi:trigger factor